MPYTSPAAVVSGAVISKTTFGDVVKADLDFLANPPACRVYNNANQSIAHAVEQAVLFNSELYDTDTMHSTSVSTDRITFTTAGLYTVSFTGQLTVGTDYIRGYALFQTSGGVNIATASFSGNGASTTFPMYQMSTDYKFTAGQYVRVFVYQVNGAGTARNLEFIAGHHNSPEFMAKYIGLG